MLAKLLFRLSTLARSSAHESTVTSGKRTGQRSFQWVGSFSEWWRTAAANAAAIASTHGRGDSAARRRKAATAGLDTTQLPDGDTLLCPRVESVPSRTRPSRADVRAGKLSDQIARARAELSDTLSDVHPDRKRGLQTRLRQAQTLRELWHLRPAVYSLISCEHSQSEADSRLASINSHFPARPSKSTFGTLDSN